MENNNLQNDENDFMENDEIITKKGKGKKVALIVIAIILVVILGIVGGIIASGNGNKVADNIARIVDKKDENKTNKKIDESKYWVYDADYGKENKKIYNDSKKTEEYVSNSSEDLIVPFININSDYAKSVNENIKKLYEDCYSKYGTAESTPYSNEYKTYKHYALKYDKYITDNILSVVISLHEGVVIVDGGAGGGTNTVYTYNFNLDTLAEASLDEMAKKCGFSSGNAVSNKIKDWEKKQGDILAKADFSDIFKGVQANKYYIDDSGKLNFIYKISTSGSFENSQIVENDKEIELFFTDENAKTQKEFIDETVKKQEEINKKKEEENNKLVKYEKDSFSFYAPQGWKCQIKKVDNSQYKTNDNDVYYEITGNVNGKEEIAFSIMITSDRTYDNSSWVNKGEYNDTKYIYVMQRFICRDNDGIDHNDADYKFEKQVGEAIRTLSIKYTVKNEFGSADKTKQIEGLYFYSGKAGTSNRAYMYYIQDGKLCKTSLTDDFATEVLADHVASLHPEGDGKLHASPQGDSFMNNISQEDDGVVFDKIN